MRANFDRDNFYPVRSYYEGDKRIAEFSGVRRVATTATGHAEDMVLLKRAERIADSVLADPAGGTHYVDRDEPLDHGYLVGLKGFESQIDLDDSTYADVYAACVEKLESIKELGWGRRPIGVGWWTRNGCTYIDVSINVVDRAEALAYAERADQIAIYDVANQCDIDIRYA